MESRKIFRSGKGSYIITLPKDWVLSLGLKEGDQVYLKTEKNKIIITSTEKKSKKSEIYCESLSFNAIVRRIISYYLAGYDVLRLKICREDQRKAIVLATDLLVGAEIIEDLGDEIEVIIQLNPEKLNLEEVIEKIFKICYSMLSDFIECLFSFKKETISSIIFREDEVDRLTLLILRLTGNVYQRAFTRALERVADHVEMMAESLLNLNKSYDFDFAKEVLKVFKSACISFLKKDINLADETLNDVEKIYEMLPSYQRWLLSFNKDEMLHVKTIFDSLYRVLAYSSDIAENTINLVIASQ